MNFNLKQDYFEHFSTLHGVLHTYRVMYHVVELGKAHKYSVRDIKTTLCAAFIHDMSRRHDELCYAHGKWAIEEKLPSFLAEFKEYGLKKKDIEALSTAVEYHSLPQELSQSHLHYKITALLKDADALDRIRLGEGGLDPSYLRLKHSKNFVEQGVRLYKITRTEEKESAIVELLRVKLTTFDKETAK